MAFENTNTNPESGILHRPALDQLLSELDVMVAKMVTSNLVPTQQTSLVGQLLAGMALAYAVDEATCQLRLANLIALAQSAPVDPAAQMVRETSWAGLVESLPAAPGRKASVSRLLPWVVDALGLDPGKAAA